MKSIWRLKFYQDLVPLNRMLSVAKKQRIPDFRADKKEKRTSVSVKEKAQQQKVPVITCKNEKLNYYKGQVYSKFDVVPLASNGWHHRKSKGDYFEIKNYGEVPFLNETINETFQSLGVPENIVQVLQDKGIQQPTNIQADGIKPILQGQNTLLSAETGSGKTFAYLLPLITKICEYRNNIQREYMNSPFGLIITPSRELADQIGKNGKLFSDSLGIKVEVITGGHTKRMILNPSFNDVDLVVASIGAISKLITTGIYRTSHIRHVVLDEADSLLDDSFNSKLLYILRRFSFLPTSAVGKRLDKPVVQIIMASATIPTSMNDLLSEILSVDTLHRITSKHLHCIQPHVPQKFMRVGRSQKVGLLLNIAKSCEANKYPLLIFSNKSSTCDWISLFLNENEVKCINLNGDMAYELRVGKFEEFQEGYVNVLSCTDMGSRGLDTIKVKHLLNYDFPIYMADYIHRCGRTGRIGSPQNCHITHFISSELEIELVQKIELAVRRRQPLPNVNANIRRIIQHKYRPRDVSF